MPPLRFKCRPEEAAAGGDAGAKSPKKAAAAADSEQSSDWKQKPKKPKCTAAVSPKKAFAAPESDESGQAKPKPKKAKDTGARSSKKALAAVESEQSLELMPQAKKTKGPAARSSKKALAAVDSDEFDGVKACPKKSKERTPSILSASSCSCIFTNTPTPEPERPENKLVDKVYGQKKKSLLSKEEVRSPGEKDLGGKRPGNARDAAAKSDPLLHGDHDGAGEKKDKKKPDKGLVMRAEVHHEERKDADREEVRDRDGMTGSDEECSERKDLGGGEVTTDERRKGKRRSRRQQAMREEPDQRQSPSDLLALVYEGSRSGLGNVLRAMSQRALPSGSSVLGSITGSSRSLARNLFRRYKTIEDDSEEGGLSKNFSLP
ncbi:uncharacterized protein LOC144122012 [Amblyomma americanum]